MQIVEGSLNASGLRFGLVTARFNDFITSRLEEGAIDTLARHGADKNDLTVVRVPGAFEIPVAAKKLARVGGVDAIIALGAVIRGSTTHYDYVCNIVSKGIHDVSMETGVPVSFGVITTESIEQAIERAGTKAGNKGAEAAIAAVEMAQLMRQIGD